MSTHTAGESPDDLKSLILSLDERRKSQEEEASAITDELTTSIDGKEPIGISTPLVDEEGYPRADVDVYRARHLRKRLNEIRFDHNMLMKKMEEVMIQKMANEKDEEMDSRKKKKPKPKYDSKSGKWVVSSWDGTVAGVENGHLRKFDDIGKEEENGSLPLAEDAKKSTQHHQSEQEDVIQEVTPFAKIEKVLADSPASEARLKVGDELCRFGTVDYTNHRGLRAMSDVVSRAYSDSASVMLVVLRKKCTINGNAELNDEHRPTMQQVTLKLTPKPWTGKGFVGCVFSPIQ